MTATVQRWCLWCGPAMIVLWLGGFVSLAHFLIPPPPADGAAAVAEMYRTRTTPIRLGLVLTTVGSALLGPFLMAIAAQTRQIEGRFAPLTYLQIGFGCIFVLEFIGPAMLWQVAAYRPERTPEITQALNDIGWLLFVGIASTIVVQLLAIGAAILIDRREVPIYPRWVGYYTVFTGVLIIPSNMIVFFHRGPLAWNGLFAWYIPVAVFAGWVGVLLVHSLRAVSRQQDETLDGDPALPVEVRRRFDEMAAELEALRLRLPASPPGDTALLDRP